MPAPVVDATYKKSIEKARRDLRAFIAENNCAPLVVRLTWHDAGTYDANTMTGGANGSIRSEREYTHGANAGIKKAVDWMEDFKVKYSNLIYAGLYQALTYRNPARENGIRLTPAGAYAVEDL
ncbi:unnamed protein product [Calypogeia fissa]